MRKREKESEVPPNVAVFPTRSNGNVQKKDAKPKYVQWPFILCAPAIGYIFLVLVGRHHPHVATYQRFNFIAIQQSSVVAFA